MFPFCLTGTVLYIFVHIFCVLLKFFFFQQNIILCMFVCVLWRKSCVHKIYSPFLRVRVEGVDFLFYSLPMELS